ncbi:hypothetical protein [Actinoplanes teichomyceticus]|uniref:Uncharacterized protein n=1 Tax=Actinoplanes teichomyceticus TaxID=1867 RepID=A0A561WAV6_ACTTI|nr:hypothetical protein [Actinoplanes teichomyceticus]TWG20996.1 hypothetical protein FHX34_103525 [Actinoplanes teichomyceticus]GIF14816.1 hypothetical protein Ate01nite_48480 [Actinoplanes teichomyceticus]
MFASINRGQRDIRADHQPAPATPLTIRLRHIDVELAKLSRKPRTVAALAAIDFYPDRRLDLRPGGQGGARRG